MSSRFPCFAALFCFTFWSAAQAASRHYALILQDPPVAERFTSVESMRSAPALQYRRSIQTSQRRLVSELGRRRIAVSGSADTVLNAVFVNAAPARAAELRGLAGVKAVVEMRSARKFTNQATQLVNGPAAWTAAGGVGSAGAGIRIAILDTGIDQTHPAFQDSSLTVPAGFPVCSGFDGDCSAFTNNKVIVARSYVSMMSAGTDAANPAADSRPDDVTPRDQDGHGTAVASIAAGVPNGAFISFNGMAPKAFLGNYKVFGSPQVNDSPPESVFIQAIDDAVKDNMDVINISAGFIARYGPLDTGAACGQPADTPCNPLAAAVERATRSGKVVVAAVGNNGFDGDSDYPTYNTIASPADAPSAIAVGATLNSHLLFPTVSLAGANPPSNLTGLAAVPSESTGAAGAVTAPIVDAAQAGGDPLGCSAYPSNALFGAFVLVLRGTCAFSDKADFAQAAGAVGVIFYMADSASPIPPGGLSGYLGPMVMISNADGTALKTFVDANPNARVTIDAAGAERDASANANLLAGYSSFGPSTGDAAIKPELVAPGGSDPTLFFGAGMYTAAQSVNPLGGIYSQNGYAVADSLNFAASGTTGTSLAAPLVAGAAALVKQQHPSYTPAQIKSALVNTADSKKVTTNDQTLIPLDLPAVDLRSAGNGLLQADAAMNAAVTVSPATFSFGAVTSSSASSAAKQVQLTNNGAAAVNLTLAVAPDATGSGVTPTLDKTTLALAPGASGTVSLALNGSSVKAGPWTGFVTVQGAGTPLQIPFMYLVTDGIFANIVPNSVPRCGPFLAGATGQDIGRVQIKVIDVAGLPVPNAAVGFAASPRTVVTLQNVSARTDNYGIATAEVIGQASGQFSINASVGRVTLQNPIGGLVVDPPAIANGGVIGAGNSDAAKPVAPGSAVRINGTALSLFTDQVLTATLPMALDFVNVSFDVPGATPPISLPGRLLGVSPGAVLVQVPWELRGQSSAQMKVTFNCSYSNVVTVSLADYAPALFERGGGVAAAIDANGQSITSTNPAKVGQNVTLLVNGLGPVSNQPASGSPGPSSPQAETTTKPVVTIGGSPATVVSSGLTPGVAGQYSVVVTVPAGATGSAAVTVSIGGETSKPSNLPIG